ncbi:MAG: hypothetical protein U0599_04165 [Vicinamibacteria bacterium]
MTSSSSTTTSRRRSSAPRRRSNARPSTDPAHPRHLRAARAHAGRPAAGRFRAARLHAAAPRRQGHTALRLGGGIGTRGPGETKLETDRRRIRRGSPRWCAARSRGGASGTPGARRARGGGAVVALVGYTNAGKSTFNALTWAAPPSPTGCS